MTASPATLFEAHHVLLRRRPKLADDPTAWVAFHRHAAEVYAKVAESDTKHQHEARYWAGHALRRAREISP